MNYTPIEIEIANKTSRAGGAVGNNAVTPKVVKSLFSPEDKKTILDFGAGKAAIQTLNLRAEGYDVTAYEFGDNVIDGLHDKNVLERKYDVIFASNVLNVQSSPRMLFNTLGEIWEALNDGGVFIANYPASPRKMHLTVSELTNELEEGFIVERIPGKNIIFKLTKKQNDE